jgi:hypothetical protein
VFFDKLNNALQEEISRARLAEHALNGGGGMADMDNF